MPVRMSSYIDDICQRSSVALAMETILDELQRRSKSIDGIRKKDERLSSLCDQKLGVIEELRGKPLIYPYIQSGAGKGALVELEDGSVKWDMICGIGVHFAGHCHPNIMRAQLISALDDVTKHGNLQSSYLAYEFSSELIKLASKTTSLSHSFLTTSGAMANEMALKLCFQHRYPARRVLAFERCFMGRTLAMTSIGDNASAREGFLVWWMWIIFRLSVMRKLTAVESMMRSKGCKHTYSAIPRTMLVSWWSSFKGRVVLGLSLGIIFQSLQGYANPMGFHVGWMRFKHLEEHSSDLPLSILG